MKIVYPTSLVPVKAGFRVHYTLRLEGATIHVMATHKEMPLLVIFTLAVALGFVHVIATEISWQKHLADMAREVRERHEQA